MENPLVSLFWRRSKRALPPSLEIPTEQFSSRRAVSSEEMQRLGSEYLQKGCFSDDFEVSKLIQRGPHFEATFKMTRFGISPQDRGGFHLTAPTIFRMTGQAVIVHVQRLFGFEEKCIEVWVREHHMKHCQPVRQYEKLKLVGKVEGYRRAKNFRHIWGLRFKLEMEGGAVVGQSTVFFDLTPLKNRKDYEEYFDNYMKKCGIRYGFGSIISSEPVS